MISANYRTHSQGSALARPHPNRKATVLVRNENASPEPQSRTTSQGRFHIISRPSFCFRRVEMLRHLASKLQRIFSSCRLKFGCYRWTSKLKNITASANIANLSWRLGLRSPRRSCSVRCRRALSDYVLVALWGSTWPGLTFRETLHFFITDATTETRETWENPEVVSCMVQNMLHMSKK